MRRTAIALGCGVLVLAGCGTDGSAGSAGSVAIDSGQAAVSQDFRVSQSQVAADVAEVLAALGQPASQPPEGLASATTQRLVQGQLIESFAATQGIELTRAQGSRDLSSWPQRMVARRS